MGFVSFGGSSAGGGSGLPESDVSSYGLSLNGSGWIATPDDADFDITGDLEVVFRAELEDWTPTAGGTFVARRATSNLQFQITNATNGDILLGHRTGSTDYFSDAIGANPGFQDGATYWIKVTRDASTGEVNMYYAEDQDSEPTSWTALTVTGTQTPGAPDNVTSPLEVGTNRAGSNNLVGRMLRAIMRDGIDGTVVADFNADIRVSPYTDVAGKVWTIGGSGSTWSL